MSQGRNSNFPKLGCFVLLNYFSVPLCDPASPSTQMSTLGKSRCFLSIAAPAERAWQSRGMGVSIERSKRTKESRDVKAI